VSRLAGRTIAGLALALALALAGAGCASTTRSTTSTHSRRVTSTTITTRSPAASTTATTTTTSSTSTLPGAGRPAVTIGDKNYTEQFVLGQLYLQALQAQGFTVNLNQNIGPTDVTLQALKTGALTMYPEYLNTFDSAIAGYHHGFRTRLAAYRAAQRYGFAHGLSLLATTPFSNTDAIAVTVAYAHDNRLDTIFDLRRVAGTMAIAGPPQFAQSPPGLPELSSAYGVTPATFKALPVGAQYAALNGGTVQAAYVNTTDGQLASGDYRLLTDHRRIFGWGNVMPVVSTKALAAEGPAFVATIERVSRMLTTPVMRQLNAAVDVAKQDPAAAAKQFLQTHGLLEPLGTGGGG
jgi:osmoprotectant transport system substrate-binding protein